VLVRQAL